MPEARKVDPVTADAQTPAVLDPDRFCAEIVAGRHTGHLAQILTAVRGALTTGSSSMRWRIKVDALGDSYSGRTVTEDSITLQAVTTAERLSGHTWGELEPTKSAGDCHALIMGWLIEDEGLPMVEAMETAKHITLGMIPGMIDAYEVVHGPKEDGTPTSGSGG